MKASLKFREESKPLFKAKVPLSILGLPFQSTLAGGDSKELSLSLGTLFDQGPSFRVSYRPNDAFNPFSLSLKTGIGPLGAPSDAPFTISAQFDFPSGDPNYLSAPTFSLHFKPRLGDFSLRKKQQSTSIDAFAPALLRKQNGAVSDEEDGSIEVVERPGGEITGVPLKASVEGAVSGMEVGANTVLPIRKGAVMKLRWGVRFPEGLRGWWGDRTAGAAPRAVPSLVLSKIGIEHVAAREAGPSADVVPARGGGADVAEACFGVKRQLEVVRAENAALGRAMEDLRAEFRRSRGGKSVISPEFGRRESDEGSGTGGRVEDLKKP